MKEKPKPALPARRQSLRALAADVPRLTKLALGRKGFAEAELIAAWAEIMGPDLARLAMPIKLSRLSRQKSGQKSETIGGKKRIPDGEETGAVLTLRASGAAALEIQHLQPLILERINLFFGYPAVSRLRIDQSGRRVENTPRPTGNPGGMTRILAGPPPDPAPYLATIEDQGLKTRLAALGRSILRESNRPPSLRKSLAGAILPAAGKPAKKPE